jgi:hypothetical protein
MPPAVAALVKGCLFYRFYARPQTAKVFEQFSCPTWEHQIVATVQLDLEGGESETIVVTLHPGMSWNWQKVSTAH